MTMKRHASTTVAQDPPTRSPSIPVPDRKHAARSTSTGSAPTPDRHRRGGGVPRAADLGAGGRTGTQDDQHPATADRDQDHRRAEDAGRATAAAAAAGTRHPAAAIRAAARDQHRHASAEARDQHAKRSEEHTSELQSLMRISYAVFCLKKNTTHQKRYTII